MTRDEREHDAGRIAAYVEDRLSPAERAAASEHFASCAECRAVLAGLLRARLALPAAATGGTGWYRRLALPVAATILVGLAAGLIVSRRPSPPPPDAVAAPPADAAPIRRSPAERSIGGKQFRLVAGEWVDTAYDPFALLDAVTIATAADRDRITAERPPLRQYLPLGPRFVVVHDGRVYRFALPGP